MTLVWLPLFLSALTTATDPLPDPARFGLPVEDFSLRDDQGQTHRLSDWKNRKLIVAVFLGVDCPIAKLYGPRLAELSRTYEDRGVTFLGIHANQHESLADLTRYAGEHHIPFPLLQDLGNTVADRFGATRTCEAFILDKERRIRYRGRIDGQYGVGHRSKTEYRRDLIEALEELLADKPVSQPATEAVGCLISRVAPPGKGKVTYTKDISPILQNRCQECHRQGQIAPFALTTYKEAAGWASTMREVVEQDRMPPWSANPKYGRFANDPSLTAAEKKLLLEWLDADCPEGDPADLLPARRFSEEWSIAQPDLVLTMPEPFTVPAEGVIEYQFIVVDPCFKEDRWVQMAEIRPGNRAVVHHCNVYLQPPGVSEPQEVGTLGSYCLAAMASGTPPLMLPPGTAKRVPAGWRLLFVLHYSAIGSEQTDQTSIALKFADSRTIRKEVATKLMYEPALSIPPNEAYYPVTQTWQVQKDVLLLSLFPHMHLRGKSFRYEALYSNGEEEVLLDVPRFDFNWQRSYVLAEPKRLPAGTRLRCTAVYDNSAGNPANPDPSATVCTGTQSWEEMFNGYFDVVLADQDLTQPPPWHAPLRAMGRFLFSPGISVLILLAGGLFLSRRWFATLLAQPRPVE